MKFLQNKNARSVTQAVQHGAGSDTTPQQPTGGAQSPVHRACVYVQVTTLHPAQRGARVTELAVSNRLPGNNK
jgi:hypothetical protein